MRHRTTPRFWEHYRNLPEAVRDLADKNFQLLQSDPRHPSLQFKKVGNLWSARVGLVSSSVGSPGKVGMASPSLSVAAPPP